MIDMYCEEIKVHYETVWANHCTEARWQHGPVAELPQDFRVLVFPATKARQMWTYATCCMSQPLDEESIELHLFSPILSDRHVELLTVVARYHRTGNRLGLGHTVNFGRPWLPGSSCEYGLISLPYLDGPALENYQPQVAHGIVRFLWLVPITKEERDYKKRYGLESLESRFEETQFDYLDPNRGSVV